MIRDSLAPLRLSAYRWLLAGRTISVLGNTFAPMALAFAVLDLTGSPTDLGLVVGTRQLVNVLFLLFGGVLADRLPKHLLMIGASVAAAATQATIAALVLTGNATVPLLLVLSAVNGMVGALSLPASSAILPQLVPADLRQRANGLTRLFFNAAAIIGAPIAGIVVATVGPGWGIAVDAATFVLAACCYTALRVPAGAPSPAAPDARVPEPEPVEPLVAAAEPAPARQNIFRDLSTGWGEFVSRTWLWVVVAGFCVINASLTAGLSVLGPVVADDTVGRRAWGLVLAADTVGMIIGAVIAMRIRVHRLLLLGVAGTGLELLPMLTLGVAPHLGLLMAAAFVAGVGIEQFGIAWETTMQEHIPAEKLARVYSYDMVGSFIAIPIGQVLAGPIAQAVGVEATLVGAAVLIGVAVLGMLSSRDVRQLRHRLPDPASRPMEELPA
jgi:MFS family permease